MGLPLHLRRGAASSALAMLCFVGGCGQSNDGEHAPASSGGAGGVSGTGGAGAHAGTGSGGSAGSGASSGSGGSAGSGASGGLSAAGMGGMAATAGIALRGPPLLFAPTGEGFGLSAVLSAGDPAELRARVRPTGTKSWSDLVAPEMRAPDLAQWSIDGLSAGAPYEYEILASASDDAASLYLGSITTQREEGASFSFALVSDTHIGSDLEYSNQGDEAALAAIGANIAAAAPDFVVNLGDILDFHEYGFNTPPPDGALTRAAYVNYRASFGDVLGHTPHFPVLGGWDSENGCDEPEEIDRSRSERLLYLPGPKPSTYPAGGSPFEDYYAFTWGDALFVMLNVFTYTPGCHLLGTYPGLPDDWTLGDAQFEFLRNTLENATSKWRFLLIHHPVGGKAGNDVDSAYGRGGGLAAEVGEQALVHELMQEHGVQAFFYGHDHVFTDMIVDDIHYTLPGSAGAIWHFSASETGYTEFWPDPGWARVDVTPDEVRVQFLSVNGTVLHEYSLD